MNTELCYSVYMHINKINNKKYIGITKTSLLKRWGHNGSGYNGNHQPLFENAIKKYGWDNFEHLILYQNVSKEQACKKEIELISLYKTQDRRYGYNIQPGGQLGNTGVTFSDEAKEKMRNAKLGKKLSEEHKMKISKSCKGHKPAVHTKETKQRLSELNKGKVIPEETKKRISNTLKGIKKSPATVAKMKANHTGLVKVYCPELNMYFSSIAEASSYTGVWHQNIDKCLSGERHTAGKHPHTDARLHWLRIE